MFLSVYGCSTAETTTSTNPSPTTTSKHLNELTFDDFLIDFGMEYLDVPTQIHIVHSVDSPLPDVVLYVSSETQAELDAVDFSQYFILFAFMGSQPLTGPAIEVIQIWQIENIIYVEAFFDQGGPTYRPAHSSPLHIVKVSKDNMTQFGEITLIFLDQNGIERARTVCEIPE
jgi:hypothetical protein